MRYREGSRSAQVTVSLLLAILLQLPVSAADREPASEFKPEANVVKEGNKVYVAGVARLSWDSSWNTALASVTVCAQALGCSITYEELMGFSAAGFRLLFHQPNWCPSSPDGAVGYNHLTAALDALGFTYERVSVNPDEDPKFTKAQKRIEKSIERGFPIIANNLRFAPEWGVIVGYDSKTDELLCRTFYDPSDAYAVAEHFPLDMYIITAAQKSFDRRLACIKSIEAAVELHQTERFGEYVSGETAYRAWIADLRNPEFIQNKGADELNSLLQINGWCYRSLQDARRAAGHYLRIMQSHFTLEQGERLYAAQCLYERISDDLTSGMYYAPMPWEVDSTESWTPEKRMNQSESLQRTAALERAAVDQLKQFLTQVK